MYRKSLQQFTLSKMNDHFQSHTSSLPSLHATNYTFDMCMRLPNQRTKFDKKREEMNRNIWNPIKERTSTLNAKLTKSPEKVRITKRFAKIESLLTRVSYSDDLLYSKNQKVRKIQTVFFAVQSAVVIVVFSCLVTSEHSILFIHCTVPSLLLLPDRLCKCTLSIGQLLHL